jgi:hypothetical protein
LLTAGDGLKNRRTISTFFRDIAYSSSPAASRASSVLAYTEYQHAVLDRVRERYAQRAPRAAALQVTPLAGRHNDMAVARVDDALHLLDDQPLRHGRL